MKMSLPVAASLLFLSIFVSRQLQLRYQKSRCDFYFTEWDSWSGSHGHSYHYIYKVYKISEEEVVYISIIGSAILAKMKSKDKMDDFFYKLNRTKNIKGKREISQDEIEIEVEWRRKPKLVESNYYPEDDDNYQKFPTFKDSDNVKTKDVYVCEDQ